jgi:hypothetical protein
LRVAAAGSRQCPAAATGAVARGNLEPGYGGANRGRAVQQVLHLLSSPICAGPVFFFFFAFDSRLIFLAGAL